MNPYAIKFGVAVLVGLIGLGMIQMRQSIGLIIIGFLLDCVAVIAGTYYLIQLRKPKNPMQDEIDAITLVSKQKDRRN